jgi:site-specific recombinase XerD
VCAGEKTGRAIRSLSHDFLHRLAIQIAPAGVDLAAVAAILGHHSSRTVQKYVHRTAEHRLNAIHKLEGSLLTIFDRLPVAPGSRVI